VTVLNIVWSALMTVTSIPFSSYEPRSLPSIALEETENAATPSGWHIRRLRLGSIRWIQENTFFPSWLPDPLRYPLIGYLVAGLIEGIAAILILLLLFLFPPFVFHGILTLVGVLIVALGWGAGPGLFASLLATFVVYFVVLPPHFSWSLTTPANGIGLGMYLLVGASISLLAGRNAWRRRQAEQSARVLSQSETRASELVLSETRAQMDTFLGIVGHELKTPLTSLKLSLQLSQRQLRRITRGTNGGASSTRDAEIQAAMEQLSRTGQQVQRLEVLVNDLTDASRILAGQLELRLDQADLLAIVHEAVEAQQQAEPERSIRFQPPGDLSVPVYVDAGRIEQVVTNYLTNALKYSAADRPVEVGIEIEPEQAQVWVRDYGSGLPLSEQEHIWERFHQAKGVEVQSGSGVGLGLGLFISRMIVERHHGQVGVQSTPGQGATFWFTLPLSSADLESLSPR
jgi:signal transduction histidine kinase